MVPSDGQTGHVIEEDHPKPASLNFYFKSSNSESLPGNLQSLRKTDLVLNGGEDADGGDGKEGE